MVLETLPHAMLTSKKLWEIRSWCSHLIRLWFLSNSLRWIRCQVMWCGLQWFMRILCCLTSTLNKSRLGLKTAGKILLIEGVPILSLHISFSLFVSTNLFTLSVLVLVKLLWYKVKKLDDLSTFLILMLKAAGTVSYLWLLYSNFFDLPCFSSREFYWHLVAENT